MIRNVINCRHHVKWFVTVDNKLFLMHDKYMEIKPNSRGNAKWQVNLMLAPTVIERIKDLALQERRRDAGMVVILLEEALAARKREEEKE